METSSEIKDFDIIDDMEKLSIEKQIVTVSKLGTTKIWSTASGKELKTVITGKPGSINALLLHNDLLFIGSKNITEVYDLKDDFKKLREIIGHTDWIASLAHNEKYLFTGSYDSTISVYDAKNDYIKISTLTGHSQRVFSMILRGETLVTGSNDHSIKFWDINNFEIVKTLTGHTGYINCLTSNDAFVISGSSDKTIKVWIPDVECTCLVTLTNHKEYINSLVTYQNMLISGSFDKTIIIWNICSFSIIKTLYDHTDSIGGLHINMDILYSCSNDSAIKLWDLKDEDFKLIKTLEGYTEIVWCIAVF